MEHDVAVPNIPNVAVSGLGVSPLFGGARGQLLTGWRGMEKGLSGRGLIVAGRVRGSSAAATIQHSTSTARARAGEFRFWFFPPVIH